MPIYVVLAKQVASGGRQTSPGYQQLPDQVTWPTVGVFKADKAEDACQAAAKKAQTFGTFIAIEGYPWGVDLIEIENTQEFGVDEPEMSKQARLEQRSREMEREAGLD